MPSQFTHGYALLIGVSDNQIPQYALPEVAKDVQAVQRVLAHPQRCAYPSEQVHVLLGSQATRAGILAGLAWLQGKLAADPNATAVVYYSGHGWRDTAANPPTFYLIPYDLDANQVDLSALPADAFARAIARLQPRRLLAVLDCCHAAGMGVKNLAGGVLPDGYAPASIPVELLSGGEAAQTPAAGSKGLEQLATGSGRAVLSSSQGRQPSYIRADRAMSIFTYHLIEALTGHAQQPGASEVLVSDVMSHVHRRVPESAQAEYNVDQQPDYQVSGNFPVALLLGGKGLGKGIEPPDPIEELPGSQSQSPVSYQAVNTGPGAIAQGNHNVAIGAGGVYVKGDVDGDVVTSKKVDTGGGPYFGGKTKIDSFFQGDQNIHYEDRSVRTNGPMIGSNIITGDKNRITTQSGEPNLPEFMEMLRTFQADLARASLPPAEKAELAEDLGKVEQQAAAEKPNRGIILKRLDGVVNFLANAATIATSAPRLLEMGQKLLEWAKMLFS